MTKRIWELPFDEVRDYLYGGGMGVVIPFGTVEPHGPHLPMGTDLLLAQSIGEKIAEKFGWLVAPPLNYGVNNTLAMYPGATTIDPKTYEAFITQLIEGYIKLGFTYIVLNNGHGPNRGPLESAAKFLTYSYPDTRIFIIDWWAMDKEALDATYEGKSPGHAGVDETAAVIYFHADFVKAEKLDSKSYWVYADGFKTYPAPASCMISDKQSQPDFDAQKAKQFTEKVLDIINSKIASAIKGFDHNLGG